MNKHNQEPWQFLDMFKNLVITDSTDNIIDIRGNKANAERIVACVNACVGIPTPLLLSDNRKHDAFFEAIELEQQRDSLLSEVANLRTELAQKQIEIEAMKAAFDEYKYNAEAGMRLVTEADKQKSIINTNS